MKYSTIAVIYGSDSSEWEVSVRSGEFTSSRIDGQLYDVYEIFARFGQWSVAAYRKEGFWFPLAAGTIGGLVMSVIGIFFYLPIFTLKKV